MILCIMNDVFSSVAEVFTSILSNCFLLWRLNADTECKSRGAECRCSSEANELTYAWFLKQKWSSRNRIANPGFLFAWGLKKNLVDVESGQYPSYEHWLPSFLRHNCYPGCRFWSDFIWLIICLICSAHIHLVVTDPCCKVLEMPTTSLSHITWLLCVQT